MTEQALPRFFEIDATEKIAEGYTRLPDGLGFNDALAPVYLKVDEAGWHCGFFVEKHHLNPMGICHGGVLMSFADLAMAGGIGHHIGEMMGIYTVNMNMDFLLPGQPGDWLVLHTHHIHTTKSLANISALIHGPRGVVARTNGIFRLPRDWQAGRKG